MNIRPYDHRDEAQVRKIYEEAFPWPFTYAQLASRLEVCRVSVMVDNFEVLGYIITDLDRGIPYLSQVAVREDCREEGIGTLLIQNEEIWLREHKATKWWLQVEFNNPAQKLYFDLGFRVSGYERNIYGPGKHSVEMTKFLQ